MTFKPGRLYMQVSASNKSAWYVVKCLDSETGIVIAAHDSRWLGFVCGLFRDLYTYEKLSDEEALLYTIGG